ncbi:MAG: phage holin family protein [Cyclobacteriaceae bacterium]|nr:phage holin family protein [Cyclobacteriaceae bacterium]
MEGIKEAIFKFLRLDNLVDNLSGYLETRLELFKIEVREDVARVLAQGLTVTAIVLLSVLFLLFFSVGLAHFLNEFLNKPYAGYWIVAGIYGLPCVIFIIFRKEVSEKFERYMTRLMKRKEK